MNYYGINPSSDFFAHYGVRGMKWGVRRALDSKNDKKLDRQYRKAKRKLEKLNSQADVDIQKIAVRKHARRALGALGIGYAGLAFKNSAHDAAKRIKNQTIHAINNYTGGMAGQYTNTLVLNQSAREKRILGEGKGISKNGKGLGIGPVGNTSSNALNAAVNGGGYTKKIATTKNVANPLMTIDRISNGLAIAGLGTAAYQAGRAIAAKKRTTAAGHAKAVAKRDAWRKEMNEVFKGTKYGSNNRRKRR